MHGKRKHGFVQVFTGPVFPVILALLCSGMGWSMTGPIPPPGAEPAAGMPPYSGISPPVIIPLTAGPSPASGDTSPVDGQPAHAMDLESCLRLALERNEYLLMGELDVESSSFGVNSARREFGFKFTPALNATLGNSGIAGQQSSLSLSRKMITGTNLDFSASSDLNRNQVGDFYNSDVRVTLTQPLLRDFGRFTNREGLKTAERRLEDSVWKQQLNMERLMLDLITTYYDVLKEEQLIETGTRSRSSAEELLDATKARLDIGRASQLDVFRAEQQILNAQSALAAVRERRDGGVDRLRLLMGLSLDEPLTLVNVRTLPEWSVIFDNEAQAVDAAMVNRIELRQVDAMVEDARRRIRVARNRLLPGLDLNLSAARRGTADELRDSFSEAEDELYVYVQTSFSSDRAAERQAYKEAMLNEKRMKLHAERLRKEVALEVRGIWRDMEMTSDSIVLAEKNLEYSKQMAELGRLRFMRGLADNFDVVASEETLSRSESQVAALEAMSSVLAIRMMVVTGTFRFPENFVEQSVLPPDSLDGNQVENPVSDDSAMIF